MDKAVRTSFGTLILVSCFLSFAIAFTLEYKGNTIYLKSIPASINPSVTHPATLLTHFFAIFRRFEFDGKINVLSRRSATRFYPLVPDHLAPPSRTWIWILCRLFGRYAFCVTRIQLRRGP
jgi:hypothetical protein